MFVHKYTHKSWFTVTSFGLHVSCKFHTIQHVYSHIYICIMNYGWNVGGICGHAANSELDLCECV
jgi:hypothetical protein